MNLDRLLLNCDEAAEVLGVKRTKLYELLNSGEIASCHVGRLRKIPRQAIEDYVCRLQADIGELAGARA